MLGFFGMFRLDTFVSDMPLTSIGLAGLFSPCSSASCSCEELWELGEEKGSVLGWLTLSKAECSKRVVAEVEQLSAGMFFHFFLSSFL